MSERASAGKTSEDASVSGADSTQAASGIEPTLAAGVAVALPTPAPPKAPEPQPSGKRAANRITDWTGREIAGRYRVKSRLGEGGMGVVYVAEHLGLQKEVAFKVIHPELAAHEDLLLRFQREALATGKLDHPHITAATDFGELEGGGAFMVTSLIRGHSLQHELDERGKMEFRRAALICSQIADALSAAHAVGIIHRDLKPDNVLIEKRSDGSESAKVLDFGVASLAGQSEGTSMQARPLTQAGTILGTPGYMSPEQASAGEVDHRTDIYALGVILWELCRGERLFSGNDITQIFAKQFKSLPAPLDLGLSSPARELSSLVTRMLAWDKSERPNTAAEVRDTLRRLSVAPETRLPALRIPVSRFPPALQKLPLPAQLEPYRGYLPHVLVALLLVIGLVAFRGDRNETVVVRTEQDQTIVEPVGGPPVKEPVKVERKPEPKPAPRVVERVEPEEEDTIIEPERPAPTNNSLRDDMQRALDDMNNSRTQNARRNAAKWIRKHREEAPAYVGLLADLELQTRCNERKEVVARMAELSDPRVLPTLRRLADSPRHGCGFLRLSDCFACLRRDLDQTIGALQQLQR